MNDWFDFFRNAALLFATLMLVKYYIFLILAPLYPIQEVLRRIRQKRKDRIAAQSEGGVILYEPKVSIVIPAWNEEVGILKTVNSVLSGSYKNIEIIIVNDGSTDNSDFLIRHFIQDLLTKKIIPENVISYFYKENEGKGHALNFGIENASGEIILTMDADSILEKDAIKNLIPYFKDSKISAVVGNVKVSKNNTIIGYTQQLEYLFGFYFKRAHAVLGAEYIFGGACAAFRKEVFESFGYFDTTNKTEDIELSMRIRFHGLHCAYAENVICYTEGASDVLGLINQRLRWKKGRMDTFLKYRSLFFSFDKRHNKFLSFFVLPFALLAEIQLFFEPISISLLATYSFISGDYLSITLGALFIFVIYIVNAFFGHHKINIGTILIFPFTWPIFYFLVWVEYIVLLRSLKMVLRGDEIVWQKWKRQGVTEGIIDPGVAFDK